jgi:hypothetical protein
MSSSLQDKTIRPGSLKGYAYYYSNRTPAQAAVAIPAEPKPKSRRGLMLLGLLVLAGGFWLGFHGGGPADKQSNSQAPSVAAPVTAVNHCSDNTDDKLIKIGINERHLWACEGSKQVYDTPVITGLRGHAETETPLGTYHIYAKQTNTTLTGTDSRGTWKDPVYYWMPFLDNQYGTYGFHDATWRNNSAFGSVNPDSEQASHGCVELPLAASKWLYEWAPVNTTVTVEA